MTQRCCVELGLAAGWGILVCDLAPLPAADLAAVDTLARLQLASRRCGCDLRARGAAPGLRALWRWVGLANVAPLAGC